MVAHAVHACGLPVPAAGEIVQVNGRYGLVYQRVEGQPMLNMLLLRPWRQKHYARRMAELHAGMHAAAVKVDLPALRDHLRGKITSASALPRHLRAKALTGLEVLPEGDRLCHGDFHPGNVLINRQGEIVIDWVDATLGSPLADVARTAVILQGAGYSDQVKIPVARAIIRHFYAVYIQRYFELRPGGEETFRALFPVVAAARLSENIAGLETWLIKQVEEK